MTDVPTFPDPAEHPLPQQEGRHVARIVLGMFVLTFVAARILVIAIMTGVIPDLFLRLGQTHVHHLNYGIFLLAMVGAYLLFRRPESGPRLELAALAYGAGLALTFDEFGMWLHLGGSYWQRGSFDAIVVIAATLGLIAYAPSIRSFAPQHWFWTVVIAGAIAIFMFLTAMRIRAIAQWLGPILRAIEQAGPK